MGNNCGGTELNPCYVRQAANQQAPVSDPIPTPPPLKTPAIVLLVLVIVFLLLGMILAWLSVNRYQDQRLAITSASLITISLLLFISLTVVLVKQK